MTTNRVSGTLLFILTIGALGIGGCGSKTGDKAATQVAAKVNGSEISLHQVNHILSKLGDVPAGKMETVRKSVLDRLIDQELFAAKAVDAKLDRTPETLMALEMARREILARAYVDQLMAAAPKLSQRDVSRYYMEHPELFAERRVFALQELTFATPAAGIVDLQSLVDKKAAPEKIEEWLKSHDVAFNGGAATRPAEQLPADLLARLKGAKEGDMFLQDRGGQTAILRIAGMRRAPVEERLATPAIQRYLVNQALAEVTVKELAALKEKAKIEYVGAFAEAAKPAEAPAVAKPAEAPAANAEPAKPAVANMPPPMPLPFDVTAPKPGK